MGQAAVTTFVCVTCRGKDGNTERPGRLLFEAVKSALKNRPEPAITVTPVECLSVCKRPCTIALAAPDKWTYVIGDLDRDSHVDDIIAMALLYGIAEDGIVPWRDRPQSFRKGVVSRVPPFGIPLDDP